VNPFRAYLSYFQFWFFFDFNELKAGKELLLIGFPVNFILWFKM